MMQLRRRPELTFSTRGWSIQSGRNVSGCGSIFLDNLSYGTLMMKYLTCQRNTFREWKRVTDPDEETHEPGQTWTIRDWQHQGYQRVLSRYESFSTHHAPDQPLDGLHNPDISIQSVIFAPSASLLWRHTSYSTWRSFVPVFGAASCNFAFSPPLWIFW